MRPRGAVLAAALLTMLAAPAAAQGPAPDPPGPYVVDVRVAAGRGVGVELGGHLYAGRVGAARLGLGGAFLRLPSSSEDEDPAITSLTPQISLNFGTAAGWSYLSAGYGRGRAGADDWSGALNAGGGARWFLTDRAAFGFDLRFHQVADERVFAVSVGMSLR